MHTRRISLYWVALLAFAMHGASGLSAAEYTISRGVDAPLTFKTSVGTAVNAKSTLKREYVLLNDPASPIQIESAHVMFDFGRSNFFYKISAQLNVLKNVSAVSIRHINYDVFGRHMNNLANTDVRDFAPGKSAISGTWDARGNDVSEVLTTVTYVSRVRLADGTQWVYDERGVVKALASLKLEQRVGEKAD